MSSTSSPNRGPESTTRYGRFDANGCELVAARDEIFHPRWRHTVEIDGVGELEAFVNGDAVAVAERAGIRHSVRTAGRYTLRWPGHGDFWEKVAALGFTVHVPQWHERVVLD